MVRCVVCGEDKEADYCFDCEQLRRTIIKQYKNRKKHTALTPQAFPHQNGPRQF